MRKLPENPKGHVTFLLDRLIPDCIAMGSLGHARDHATSVYWIAMGALMAPSQTDRDFWDDALAESLVQLDVIEHEEGN